MFKKILFTLCFFLTYSISTHAATINVTSYDKNNNQISIEVPKNAERLAVIDLATLDIIDSLGLGDKIVAIPKQTKIDYLSSYFNNKDIVNTGTLKEVDYEALMQAKPDIIFIGGRLASSIDTLSKIAPVVYIRNDYQKPYLQRVRDNVSTITRIYALETKANKLIDSFEQRIKAIASKAQNKSAILTIVTANSVKTLGNSSRTNVITTSMGFNNVASNIDTSHGNESSFELILRLNPQYIFVLDRDSAIATKGAKLARDILNNELIHNTQAYKNNNIVYLNSAVWYLAEGGIKATDLMLKDVEQALNK